jgi:predicted membrane metal-binding protein
MIRFEIITKHQGVLKQPLKKNKNKILTRINIAQQLLAMLDRCFLSLASWQEEKYDERNNCGNVYIHCYYKLIMNTNIVYLSLVIKQIFLEHDGM